MSTVQTVGANHIVDDSAFGELSVQAEAGGKGLVTTDHIVRQLELFFDPPQEIRRAEFLGRLRFGTIKLAGGDHELSVHVDADLDEITLAWVGFSGFIGFVYYA